MRLPASFPTNVLIKKSHNTHIKLLCKNNINFSKYSYQGAVDGGREIKSQARAGLPCSYSSQAPCSPEGYGHAGSTCCRPQWASHLLFLSCGSNDMVTLLDYDNQSFCLSDA